MAPQRNTPKQQGNAAANDSSAGGPEAPSAEAVPPQPDAAEMAWPLLLQHDSIKTQLPLVCKLLSCSKAVAAVVAEHCAGQLGIPWEAADTAHAQQAVAWVRKHARLVRSLDLRLDNPATSDIAAALMAAGQQRQTLVLQSLKAFSTPTTLLLLEQLPASPLTQLDWRVGENSVPPPDRPALVARVSAALGRLTALQSLQLDRGPEGRPSHQLGLSGLSALTQLTSLDFKGPLADLQHAPPQLLELDISHAWRQPGQPLDLQHLAAATALACPFVQEDDALPPNLLWLQVDDCRTVQPLLCLEQLQQLDLSCSTPGDPTAGQLQQLSRLTALSMNYSHYNGRYSRQCIEPASAAAWSLLPMQRLGLRHAQLSAPVCQHLAQLSGLTSLALDWCELPQPDSAQQLAALIRQLSDLQQLNLAGLQVAAADEATTLAASQDMQQLAQAVGSLQRLRELDISNSPQLATAAAVSDSFTGLSALTALSLAFCELPDAAVMAIAMQLPRLQSLDYSCGCNLPIGVEPANGLGRLCAWLGLVRRWFIRCSDCAVSG